VHVTAAERLEGCWVQGSTLTGATQILAILPSAMRHWRPLMKAPGNDSAPPSLLQTGSAWRGRCWQAGRLQAGRPQEGLAGR